VKFDPIKALAEVVMLWDRGSFLLWSVAAAAFVGSLVLAAGALIGSAPFVEVNKIASPWLLLASFVCAALAASNNIKSALSKLSGWFQLKRNHFTAEPSSLTAP